MSGGERNGSVAADRWACGVCCVRGGERGSCLRLSDVSISSMCEFRLEARWMARATSMSSSMANKERVDDLSRA